MTLLLDNAPEARRTDMNLKDFSHNQLIRLLSNEPRNEPAWREFYRRFHKYISLTILRTCQQIGHREGALHTEDLAQEVYAKLVKNDAQALKKFKGRYENAIIKYLAIAATRVALNSYREAQAKKRPSSQKRRDLDWEIAAGRIKDAVELSPNFATLDDENRIVLILSIEQCLERICKAFRSGARDVLIFKYYLYAEMNAESIAMLPDVRLSFQRTFGIIAVIKKRLQKCLKSEG